ncbi:hypothetical protein QBC47DRAFT_13659 [Echria macrotheca]|uniref:Ams2/SPT21 N-terminal domain-containing protein n=1 Tax=Echria macrotheca TaxID=438768 RepID=A0AAJ0BML4_9PEZI|nr:hypothetical protein QBC47DRAFT_13659 [Echria macrotheca]
MATPNGHMWSAPSPQPPVQPVGGDDFGLQARPMGLKVQYTFDRDSQVNCLARWPHILQIQTMMLDERTSIGVVDLRTCLQAVAQCSPEIVNQHDTDYSIYATDFSEPDWPLVGQGMLSWCLQNSDRHQLVTGRVTRNIMAILGSGSRDTLEVKLKLTAVAKMLHRTDFPVLDALDLSKFAAATPTDTASEWNSFIQSNPLLGHAGNVASMPSPALPPAQLSQQNTQNNIPEQRFMEPRPESLPPQPIRPSSIPPQQSIPHPSVPQHHAPAAPPVMNRVQSPAPPVTNRINSPALAPAMNRVESPAPLPVTDRVGSPAVAPQPVEMTNGKTIQPLPPARPSRPSSRSRHRPSTGRPRGRPRKKPLEAGNTSAAEEATDGDEGPAKKRAKVTQTEYSSTAPFGSAPDSLRVHASISGSLRNLRPVGSIGDATGANHLQDVPRAPTPVPDMPLLQKQQQKMRALASKVKQELTSEPEIPMEYQRRLSRPYLQGGTSQAGYSPDSVAQSPDLGYSPEDSPADLGSSPPVPRTSAYLNSSPMPSSPILPAMPLRQVDSGFMSGGIDELFDEEDVQELPRAKPPTQPGQPRARPASKPMPQQQPKKPKGGKANGTNPQDVQNFPFQEVHPGPPELLPVTSIFNPAGKAKALNRPPGQAKKPASRPLKRSNTAPGFLTDPIPPPPDQFPVQQPVNPPHPAANGQLQPPPQQPQPSQLSEQPQLLQFSEQPRFLQFAEPPQLPRPSEPSQPPQLSEQPQKDGDSNVEMVLQRALESEVAVQETDVLQNGGIPQADTTALQGAAETPEPVVLLPTQPVSRPTSRPTSSSGSRDASAPIPASDPAQESAPAQSRAFMSEAPCPLDEEPPRYSKNHVKKQTIKERLDTAIQKGEPPLFCCNCGAIETPTWRKIWTQERQGVPEFHEFSDKPGFVTTIDVLERDPEGQPSMYRLIKKHLGPNENKKHWNESVLCNPCGIWLAKFKGHRPPDRWEKDAARLGQPRRKRDNKNGNGKGKKARSKSDAQMNPTSEAYFTTDPLGPADQESPKEKTQGNGNMPTGKNGPNGSDRETSQSFESQSLNLRSSPKHRGLGSTHSRGSGTADSPIAIEDDLGTTRRLLFPSPRKDGVPKVLGELTSTNIQMSTDFQESKSAAAGKENAKSRPERPGTPPRGDCDDLDQELFGTPPNRPSTPPSKSVSSGVFKTPTRPTPSHRPITRSISRSIRSVARSPGQVFSHLVRTPSKTPRSSGPGHLPVSTSKRRSPRNAQLHAHFALEDVNFDSPFTATLSQLLSEAHDFTTGSPSHGLSELDLAGLPNLTSDLDVDATDQQLANTLDFSNFLGTDLIMPSSPPLLRHHGGSLNFGADIWAQIEKGSAMEIEGVEVAEAN